MIHGKSQTVHRVVLGLFVRDRQPCRHVRDATVNRSASIILPSGSSVSRARMWRLLRRDPRWRVLMLRTFDLALKGAANKSARGIALGGRHRRRGHAATAWRSARVALGAGLPTPTPCPTDRSPSLILDPGFRGVRAC